MLGFRDEALVTGDADELDDLSKKFTAAWNKIREKTPGFKASEKDLAPLYTQIKLDIDKKFMAAKKAKTAEEDYKAKQGLTAPDFFGDAWASRSPTTDPRSGLPDSTLGKSSSAQFPDARGRKDGRGNEPTGESSRSRGRKPYAVDPATGNQSRKAQSTSALDLDSTPDRRATHSKDRGLSQEATRRHARSSSQRSGSGSRTDDSGSGYSERDSARPVPSIPGVARSPPTSRSHSPQARSNNQPPQPASQDSNQITLPIRGTGASGNGKKDKKPGSNLKYERS